MRYAGTAHPSSFRWERSEETAATRQKDVAHMQKQRGEKKIHPRHHHTLLLQGRELLQCKYTEENMADGILIQFGISD